MSFLLHFPGKARLPYFLLGPSHLAHSPCIVFWDQEIRATTILPEGKQLKGGCGGGSGKASLRNTVGLMLARISSHDEKSLYFQFFNHTLLLCMLFSWLVLSGIFTCFLLLRKKCLHLVKIITSSFKHQALCFTLSGHKDKLC